jgi:rifampicin phosphotransferase
MSYRPAEIPSVVWLGEPRGADPALVGPKAAHLSRLASAHPVPVGFCLTAEAYRVAEAAGGLTGELTQQVGEAYERLVEAARASGNTSGPAVAVRSSAIDEDGPTASFAGQHDTVLNVEGFEAVLEAVDRTWRSLRSESALAYRRRHGLPIDGVALAVLVQRMVMADAAGVAFSVDPVAGRRDRVVVSASWGLGESVVGGTVTPDMWTLDKDSLDVVDMQNGEKRRMTVGVHGGTREVEVPSFLRARPALGADQVEQVARLARDLERRLGWPVDIEFAFAAGRLHLLQCRPVTTMRDDGAAPAPAAPKRGARREDLPAPTWREPGDEARFWKRDEMHFPAQLTALDGDYLCGVIEHGFAHAIDRFGLPFTFNVRRFWTYYYDSDGRREVAEEDRPALEARQEELASIVADLERHWSTHWLAEIDAHLDHWSGTDLAALNDDALAEHLSDTMGRARRLWEIHFEVVAAISKAVPAFIELYTELFSPESTLRPMALLQGFDNLTTRAGRRLWQLRELAERSPEVTRTLCSVPAGEAWPALERLPEARPLLDGLQAYLVEFGHRCQYLRLSAPTLVEDPTPSLKTLQDAVQRAESDPERRRYELAAERDRLIREARQQLERYPAPIRDEFERRLAAAQTAARLKEDHNYLIDYTSTAAVRRVFLEAGRRLAAAGVVEARDDVLHLTSDEVWETLRSLPHVDRRALVAERTAELERFAEIDVPNEIGTPPAPAAGTKEEPATGTAPRPGTLKGTPGSPGLARGRARVLTALEDAPRLLPGEVLVARTTAQPWTPLFATAAALVTDTGSAYSHSAVVAREYALPAVVGVGNATTVLRDGMLVEVDGDRGVVRVIDRG